MPKIEAPESEPDTQFSVSIIATGIRLQDMKRLKDAAGSIPLKENTKLRITYGNL